MNNQVSIPEGLGVKERLMYKVMMNNPADNLEKRWKLSKTQDLLAVKQTNSMSGEIKVDFSKVARLDVAFRADAVVDKEEKLVVEKEGKDEHEPVTKEMLLKKRTDLDLDYKVAEQKKSKAEMDIAVIRKKVSAVDLMIKEFFE